VRVQRIDCWCVPLSQAFYRYACRVRALIAGLVLGLGNAFRHRCAGYKTPRPFGPNEVERSVDYALSVVQRWRQFVDVRGKRVLEIGPGPDLGTGAALLAFGAESYHAVDAFPLADRDLGSFYAAMSERVGPVDEDQLAYTIATFPYLPELEGQYDLVLSHATLEHIADVPSLFRRLHALVPTGQMCHHVDAMTHMRGVRERDPLNILRYPDRTYRLMSFPGAPNRLLAGDYVVAAERAGFGDAVFHPEICAADTYVDAIRLRLPARFARRSDLAHLTFTLVTS
jgi:Methyltransferase domain